MNVRVLYGLYVWPCSPFVRLVCVCCVVWSGIFGLYGLAFWCVPVPVRFAGRNITGFRLYGMVRRTRRKWMLDFMNPRMSSMTAGRGPRFTHRGPAQWTG